MKFNMEIQFVDICSTNSIEFIECVLCFGYLQVCDAIGSEICGITD